MPRTLNEKEINAFRNKLCQTAEDLFIKHGVNGFTMRRLAATLGVSAMTPYRYYRNKSDLLAAVRIQAFQRLADILAQTCRETDITTDRLPCVCAAYTDFALTHTDQYQLMFRADRTEGETEAALQQSYQLCLTQLGDALKSHLPAAIAQDADRIHSLALALWSALHGIITTSGIYGPSESKSLHQQTELACQCLLYGIRDQESTPNHPL